MKTSFEIEDSAARSSHTDRIVFTVLLLYNTITDLLCYSNVLADFSPYTCLRGT
jgi:hypothetical protein